MQNIRPSKLYLLTPTTYNAVVDILDQLHSDAVEDGNMNEATMIGLEIVLDALGAEGYEFT